MRLEPGGGGVCEVTGSSQLRQQARRFDSHELAGLHSRIRVAVSAEASDRTGRHGGGCLG